MGTKFANVHVKTTNVDLVIHALRESYDRGPYQNDSSRGMFYIGEVKTGWLSILNAWYSWGSVRDLGERLSDKISGPILTVGYFDDDVFEVNIFDDNEAVINLAFCHEWAREEYGIESDELDIETGKTYFQIENADELEHLKKIEDAEEAAMKIAQLTGLPIWNKADWLDGDVEAASKYTLYNLND